MNTDIKCDFFFYILTGNTYWHCLSCKNGDFDFCHDCFILGRRCPCGASNVILLQIVPEHGRQRVTLSNYWGDNKTAIECDICHVRYNTGGHWICLSCNSADFAICEGCHASGQRCPCGGQTSLVHLEFVPEGGRRPFSGVEQLHNADQASLGVHQAQNDATTALAGLIPASVQLRGAHENPRIASLREEAHRLVGIPAPESQVQYIPDMTTFHDWT
jgi:hypothetical protein